MDFERIEHLRKRANRFKWSSIILVILLYVPIAYTIKVRFNVPSKAIRYAALPIFLLGYSMYNSRKRDYILSFNELITKSLVNKLRPQWTYSANEGIEHENILNTYLIEKKPYMYTSNLMTGLLENVNFKFCHVETTKTNNLSARLPKVEFKGYFFEFDFPKYNHEDIHVHPPMMKDFGNVLKIPGKVDTDSKEFDKIFKTYCKDPVEMRYVLTLGLMARMIDLQNVLPGNVSFLFSKGKVYIAIKIQGSTLEPKVSSKVDFESIESVHENTFKMVELFVNELRLQFELWDKGVS